VVLSGGADLPPCRIGMEACPDSQHLARAFKKHGHDVRLIAPKFIKPYLKSHKTDFNDAAAIAEAVTRPTMRFVTVKSNEQLDKEAIHRVRDRLISERTAVINQIRALLLEYGLPVREGRAAITKALPEMLDDAANGLSDRIRQLIAQLREHWLALEAQTARYTREEAFHRGTVPTIAATAHAASHTVFLEQSLELLAGADFPDPNVPAGL
jgi:transposase